MNRMDVVVFEAGRNFEDAIKEIFESRHPLGQQERYIRLVGMTKINVSVLTVRDRTKRPVSGRCTLPAADVENQLHQRGADADAILSARTSSHQQRQHTKRQTESESGGKAKPHMALEARSARGNTPEAQIRAVNQR